MGYRSRCVSAFLKKNANLEGPAAVAAKQNHYRTIDRGGLERSRRVFVVFFYPAALGDDAKDEDAKMLAAEEKGHTKRKNLASSSLHIDIISCGGDLYRSDLTFLFRRILVFS